MGGDAPDPSKVNTFRGSGDGGGGAPGHPKGWLQIPMDKGWVECPYCDCKIIHCDFETRLSQ